MSSKLKIIKNPDEAMYEMVSAAVEVNNRQCPCVLPSKRNEDTLCPCKAFREQTTAGECTCGRFVKVEVDA